MTRTEGAVLVLATTAGAMVGLAWFGAAAAGSAVGAVAGLAIGRAIVHHRPA